MNNKSFFVIICIFLLIQVTMLRLFHMHFQGRIYQFPKNYRIDNVRDKVNFNSLTV